MTKQEWHAVRLKDQKRIPCGACYLAGKKSRAKFCEHVHWDTGNTQGVSFYYYCVGHAEANGLNLALWKEAGRLAHA